MNTDMMKEHRRPLRALKILVGLSIALIVFGADELFAGVSRELARFVKPNQFSSYDIAGTASKFRRFHSRLLVFNGHSFEVYNLDYNRQFYPADAPPHCGRCAKIVPLLIYALKQVNPDRFEPGQPPFQVLFSTGDSATTDCVNKRNCGAADMAPLMLFGSEPKDEKVLPQLKGFPNWFYLSCLYEYKLKGSNQCKWAEFVRPEEEQPLFESLEPKVIWRGSDFCFLPDYDRFQFKGVRSIKLFNSTTPEETVQKLLDNWSELPPRWRAAVLTADAEMNGNFSWIDAKFTGPFGEDQHKRFASHGVHVSTKQSMTPREMSRYKYQIDFGGGGGTSWRGTLTKLGMPGVLFHHETPSKDWFYDEMTPWVHYIPVFWHLGDLIRKYLWAEAHPEKVKSIAQASTELFESFMSEDYMAKIYETLFVDYLSEIVNAHVNPKKTWPEIKEKYEADGFKLDRVVVCNYHECMTDAPFGSRETHSFVPNSAVGGESVPNEEVANATHSIGDSLLPEANTKRTSF